MTDRDHCLSDGYRSIEWSKCPECLSEVEEMHRAGMPSLFFSNGGKLHSKVCASKQAMALSGLYPNPVLGTTQSYATSSSVQMGAMFSGNVMNTPWYLMQAGTISSGKIATQESDPPKPKKPVIPVEPKTAIRRISLDD